MPDGYKVFFSFESESISKEKTVTPMKYSFKGVCNGKRVENTINDEFEYEHPEPTETSQPPESQTKPDSIVTTEPQKFTIIRIGSNTELGTRVHLNHSGGGGLVIFELPNPTLLTGDTMSFYTITIPTEDLLATLTVSESIPTGYYNSTIMPIEKNVTAKIEPSSSRNIVWANASTNVLPVITGEIRVVASNGSNYLSPTISMPFYGNVSQSSNKTFSSYGNYSETSTRVQQIKVPTYNEQGKLKPETLSLNAELGIKGTGSTHKISPVTSHMSLVRESGLVDMSRTASHMESNTHSTTTITVISTEECTTEKAEVEFRTASNGAVISEVPSRLVAESGIPSQIYDFNPEVEEVSSNTLDFTEADEVPSAGKAGLASVLLSHKTTFVVSTSTSKPEPTGKTSPVQTISYEGKGRIVSVGFALFAPIFLFL